MKSLCLALLLISSIVWSAETATIQQIKGQKAIVAFDQGIPFSIGQKLNVSSADGSEIGNIRSNRNLLEKKNSISLSGQFSSLKQEKQDQQTSFSLAGTYSWNKGQYEYGPELTYSFFDAGNTTTTTLIGGYFDYNLNINDGRHDTVYGGVARAGFGSRMTKTSVNKSTEDSLVFDVGGQAKFFLLSQVLAIRTELVFRHITVDKENTSGLVVNLGLQHYF
jgi:hypothetical protein